MNPPAIRRSVVHFPRVRARHFLTSLPLAIVAVAWVLIGSGLRDDGVIECRVGDTDWVWLCGEAQSVSVGYSTGVPDLRRYVGEACEYLTVVEDSRTGRFGIESRRRVICRWWGRVGICSPLPNPAGSVTTRTWMLYIPYPHLVAISAAMPAMRIARHFRQSWRSRCRTARGLCRRCGYNLTANTTGVCPECGESVQERPSA